MRFFVTSDSHWESRINKVLDDLVDSGIMSCFEEREYWGGLNGVSVVLMCRDPSLQFKRRTRFSKKERVIYLDIMLDPNEMLPLTHLQKKAIVIQKLRDEVPEIVSKYPVEGFDFTAFTGNFRSWLDGLN